MPILLPDDLRQRILTAQNAVRLAEIRLNRPDSTNHPNEVLDPLVRAVRLLADTLVELTKR